MRPGVQHVELSPISAQDLNEANIQFLHRCVGVGKDRSCVLCAVGDPAQSIYAFRGARPDSMNRLRDVFGAQTMRLTHCFRCARSVVALAARLNPYIRARTHAGPGRIDMLQTANPWAHIIKRLRCDPADALFLASCNRTLLELAPNAIP